FAAADGARRESSSRRGSAPARTVDANHPAVSARDAAARLGRDPRRRTTVQHAAADATRFANPRASRSATACHGVRSETRAARAAAGATSSALTARAQLIDLLPRVRRELALDVVPRRHEVDEDVLVGTNAEIVVEQARWDFERPALRGGL